MRVYLHGGVSRPRREEGDWWRNIERYARSDSLVAFPESWADSIWWESTQVENLTRKQVVERAGLRNIITVKRIAEKEEAHELGRSAMSACFFDKTRCADGIVSLENYRYEWDEKRQQYSRVPMDNKFCHGADAYMQFAQAYNPNTTESTGSGHVGMY